MPMAALPVNLAVLQMVQREPIVRWPGGFGGSRGGILPPLLGSTTSKLPGLSGRRYVGGDRLG